MIDPAQLAREVGSRALANRRVATLGRRPFVPTAVELASVEGGELIPGQEEGALARIVAGRYALLFANHVIGNVAAKSAPGAYFRIVECARQAFLENLQRPAPARVSSSSPDAGAAIRKTPSSDGRRSHASNGRRATHTRAAHSARRPA